MLTRVSGAATIALWVYMALTYNPAYWGAVVAVAAMVAYWELGPFVAAWWIRRTGARRGR